MWPPLPECPVRTATPATRPTPGYLPQHRFGCQGGIPDNGGHTEPIHPSKPDASHGDGTVTQPASHDTCWRDEGHVTPEPRTHTPDKALLQLRTKPTVDHPTTLARENHFIAERCTDDVITLAANTLATVMDTCDDAVGLPTERKDSMQEREHTLARTFGPPGATYQSTRTAHSKDCDECHRLHGPQRTPGHLYSDPDVLPTQLVGSTMRWNGQDQKGKDIAADGNPTGT